MTNQEPTVEELKPTSKEIKNSLYEILENTDFRYEEIRIGLMKGINSLLSQHAKEVREEVAERIEKSMNHYRSIERYDYDAGFEKALYLIRNPKGENALTGLTTPQPSNEG